MSIGIILALSALAVQPLSLDDAMRKVTEKSLDVIRGGLVDYDFARIEISKVTIKLETYGAHELKAVLVMEGTGWRRSEATSAANDILWSESGQNLVRLSVTAQCFSEPQGLAARQSLMVLDNLYVKNLDRPFRYLLLADQFTMASGADRNTMGRKENTFYVTTPIRGSLSLASTHYTCIIVQSH